jgi:hypothetical protein
MWPLEPVEAVRAEEHEVYDERQREQEGEKTHQGLPRVEKLP